MKYLITCLLLMIVLVVFCIFSASHVTQIMTETEVFLRDAINSYDNGHPEQAVQFIEKASKLWAEHKTTFGILLRHDEFDTIQTDFASLYSYAQSEDLDDFRSICASVLSKLTHIQEMEWPHLCNIL